MNSSEPKSPWLIAIKNNAKLLVIVGCLMIFAVGLSVPTLQTQNSCKPLVEWTNIEDRGCPPPVIQKPKISLTDIIKNSGERTQDWWIQGGGFQGRWQNFSQPVRQRFGGD